MNRKAATARRIIKARRDAAKAHRKGLHTLTSHAILAGVPAEDAAGVGNAMRAKAKTLGVCGHTAIMVRRTAEGAKMIKGAKRFTRTDVAVLLDGYRPRAVKYVAAREALLAYTAS